MGKFKTETKTTTVAWFTFAKNVLKSKNQVVIFVFEIALHQSRSIQNSLESINFMIIVIHIKPIKVKSHVVAICYWLRIVFLLCNKLWNMHKVMRVNKKKKKEQIFIAVKKVAIYNAKPTSNRDHIQTSFFIQSRACDTFCQSFSSLSKLINV